MVAREKRRRRENMLKERGRMQITNSDGRG